MVCRVFCAMKTMSRSRTTPSATVAAQKPLVRDPRSGSPPCDPAPRAGGDHGRPRRRQSWPVATDVEPAGRMPGPRTRSAEGPSGSGHPIAASRPSPRARGVRLLDEYAAGSGHPGAVRGRGAPMQSGLALAPEGASWAWSGRRAAGAARRPCRTRPAAYDAAPQAHPPDQAEHDDLPESPRDESRGCDRASPGEPRSVPVNPNPFRWYADPREARSDDSANHPSEP